MYLSQDGLTQLHSFSFLRLETEHLVVELLTEHDSADVVEQTQEMSLITRRIQI